MYKFYSKSLDVEFYINEKEKKVIFDDGVEYAFDEIDTLALCSNDLRKRIHDYKRYFTGSTVETARRLEPYENEQMLKGFNELEEQAGKIEVWLNDHPDSTKFNEGFAKLCIILKCMAGKQRKQMSLFEMCGIN